MTRLLPGALIALVIAAGCKHGASRPPADAHAAPTATAKPFTITYATWEEGARRGPTTTIVARSTGELSMTVGNEPARTGKLGDGDVANLRLLIDLPLAATTTVPGGEGVYTSIKIEGDKPFDVEVVGPPPAVTEPLLRELNALAAALPAPGPSFQITFDRQDEGFVQGPHTHLIVGSNGTVQVDIDGKIAVRTAPPETIAKLATLIADSALASAPSGGANPNQAFDELSITGDVKLSKHFGEPVPAGAAPLIDALDALISPPAAPATFSIAVTTQMFGVAVGPKRTVTVTSAGTLTIAEEKKPDVHATLTPAQVSSLAALLADPSLPSAKSSEMLGEGTKVTIVATGAVPLDLHYQAGSGPEAVMELARAIQQLAVEPPVKSGAGLGDECGTIAGIQCADGFTCDIRTCAKDADGTCVQAPPKQCASGGTKECGCDGKAYPSDCERLKAGVGLAEASRCAP